MINIVIDTNIVVSAAKCVYGNPAKILKMILFEEIINYTTNEILEEVKEALSKPRLKLTLLDQEATFKNYQKFSLKIEAISKFEIINQDPDDNKFLECAFDAKVDYIISGDNHLLKLKEFNGIKILNPAEFIKLINLSQSNSF